MQSVGKVIIIKKKNHENYNYDQKLDTNEYFTIDTQRFSHLKANLIRFFCALLLSLQFSFLFAPLVTHKRREPCTQINTANSFAFNRCGDFMHFYYYHLFFFFFMGFVCDFFLIFAWPKCLINMRAGGEYVYVNRLCV